MVLLLRQIHQEISLKGVKFKGKPRETAEDKSLNSNTIRLPPRIYDTPYSDKEEAN
jgi:hypothetical protein